MLRRAVAVAFCLLVCLFATEVFAGTAGLRLVQGTQGDYQFWIGPEWRDFPADSDIDRAVEKTEPYVSFMVLRLGTATSALKEDFLKELESALAKNFIFFETMDKKIEAFRGREAVWIEMSGPTPNDPLVPMRQRYYVIREGNELLGLIITAREIFWEEAWPTWQSVLDSFEFLTANTPAGV